ncbi:MAG TPA: hypothetical protein IGS53_20205 [Leptolyngbyaceae cyanobacterium M33_DOE_097]|uniref:Uncharacterized protein n=1 Tax=Oscillatoriales cyanobacterium SpSt-418 TaxID=2282169 RepID=A0A7C3PTR2_9CYAN|nr:hypothetical protein [Leptolyngbyaceae cyanobacterium M33_DOE_097]
MQNVFTEELLISGYTYIEKADLIEPPASTQQVAAIAQPFAPLSHEIAMVWEPEFRKVNTVPSQVPQFIFLD